MIRRYVNLGIPILAHANGDAAADMLIEAVGKTGTRSDHRTVMIHAQTVREDQLDRMAALGIIPSYFSAHTFSGAIGTAIPCSGSNGPDASRRRDPRSTAT
jgi:predicted amidohydrolase YtcJ